MGIVIENHEEQFEHLRLPDGPVLYFTDDSWVIHNLLRNRIRKLSLQEVYDIVGPDWHAYVWGKTGKVSSSVLEGQI